MICIVKTGTAANAAAPVFRAVLRNCFKAFLGGLPAAADPRKSGGSLEGGPRKSGGSLKGRPRKSGGSLEGRPRKSGGSRKGGSRELSCF